MSSKRKSAATGGRDPKQAKAAAKAEEQVVAAMSLLPLRAYEETLKNNFMQSKPRPAVFQYIHKFLRAETMKLCQSLFVLDMDDIAAGDDFISKFEENMTIIGLHSIAEDTSIINPYESTLDAHVMKELALQHELEQGDLERAKEFIARFRAADGNARMGMGDELLRLLNLMSVHLFAHMYYEETALQCNLWEKCSDEQLREMMKGLYQPVVTKVKEINAILNSKERRLFAEDAAAMKLDKVSAGEETAPELEQRVHNSAAIPVTN